MADKMVYSARVQSMSDADFFMIEVPKLITSTTAWTSYEKTVNTFYVYAPNDITQEEYDAVNELVTDTQLAIFTIHTDAPQYAVGDTFTLHVVLDGLLEYNNPVHVMVNGVEVTSFTMDTLTKDVDLRVTKTGDLSIYVYRKDTNHTWTSNTISLTALSAGSVVLDGTSGKSAVLWDSRWETYNEGSQDIIYKDFSTGVSATTDLIRTEFTITFNAHLGGHNTNFAVAQFGLDVVENEEEKIEIPLQTFGVHAGEQSEYFVFVFEVKPGSKYTITPTWGYGDENIDKLVINSEELKYPYGFLRATSI